MREAWPDVLFVSSLLLTVWPSVRSTGRSSLSFNDVRIAVCVVDAAEVPRLGSRSHQNYGVSHCARCQDLPDSCDMLNCDPASKRSDLPLNHLRMHAPDSAINTRSVLTNRSTDHRMSDDLLPKRVRKIRDLEKGEVFFKYDPSGSCLESKTNL